MTTHVAPRLLIVEDDADTAQLITEALEDHFGPGCVTHADHVRAALALDPHGFDLILSDMNLPDGLGLDVLKGMLQRRPDIPVVFVTGEGILDNALEAIRQGAYDYVVKAGDYLFAIPIVVEKNLAIWRTKRQNKELEHRLQSTLEQVNIKNAQLEEMVAKLETMATTDPLTGLVNRRAFNEALVRLYNEKHRYNQDLACFMIDLDRFKQYNDTLGHQAGDQLLQRVAEVLMTNCRKTDVVGRYGGDEFVILLPMTDEATAKQVGQRILREFELSMQTFEKSHPDTPRVRMSAGLACFSKGRPTTPEQLVSQADHALYHSKHSGRGQLSVFNLNPTQPHTPSHATGSQVN
ncbi:MAG: diguanylate cyclase [Phycisphaera sp.]|nr:diguanylate cyclase [Phycisphaera sp.]